jgi:hypothetical protein
MGDVTHLPTRAAKGAGGKPRSTEGRLRPGPHQSGADRSPAQQEKDMQEKQAAFTAMHRALDTKIDAAMSVADALKGERKDLRSAIHNAGFPMELWDEGYAKVKLKTKKSDLVVLERMRGLMWRGWALPYGEEPDMFKGVPEAARAGPYWFYEGYQAGILGEACVAPEGMPGENLPDFTKGWGVGQTMIAAGMKANAVDAMKAKLPAGEGMVRPDWDGWDGTDHHAWSDEQKAQFDTWFAALEGDVEPQDVPDQVLARIAYLDDQAEEPEEADEAEVARPEGEPVH